MGGLFMNEKVKQILAFLDNRSKITYVIKFSKILLKSGLLQLVKTAPKNSRPYKTALSPADKDFF